MTADLPALLARVRAATGSDGQLDRDLHAAMIGCDPNTPRPCFFIPPLTASLDAVVALIESRWPSVGWGVRAMPWGAARAELQGYGPKTGTFEFRVDRNDQHSALALLDCLLQCEIAKGGRE